MGRFNLDDYSPVEERIGLFYGDCPMGRILTSIERLDPPLVVVRAEVYRDGDDTRPWATGYAYEKEGEGHVNSTSYVENCETSAIGRALANAGYHGKRDGAPRPSREEMQKVERMGGSTPNNPPAQQNARDTFSLDTVAGSPQSKAKGRTWRELLSSDEGRGYVKWALDKQTTMAPNARAALTQAMQETLASPTDAVLLQNEVSKAASLGVIDADHEQRILDTIERADADEVRIARDWLATQMQKRKLGAGV